MRNPEVVVSDKEGGNSKAGDYPEEWTKNTNTHHELRERLRLCTLWQDILTAFHKENKVLAKFLRVLKREKHPNHDDLPEFTKR